MLRVLPQTRDHGLSYRLAGIAVFTLLTILAARVTLEIGPVPLTLQTLAVFLAGMVLGSRDGALSQVAYVLLIVAGLPLDARALGPAVFTGPTWGYLIGFIPAAFVAGYIVERAGARVWIRLLAGLVGSLFVFIPGVIVLKFNTAITWEAAISTGFIAFQLENFIKAMLAAIIAESARAALLRVLMPWRE